jgi:hypothetical protein
MSDGPLTKLMRALGVESDLAPLASVKRITERPVSLNPECLFKMTPTPMQQSPAQINQLWDGGPVLPSEIDLRGRDFDPRYEFHGTFRGKQLWTCWDHNSYDGEESSLGSGDSKEMALLDLLEKIAPYEPHATSAERELDEAIDEALDFDRDLEDPRE